MIPSRMKDVVQSLKFTNILKTTINILIISAMAAAASSQNVKCPFHYVYHFGDGATDIGNSVRIPPDGPSLPPTRPPYGQTFLRRPTGRWSDGLIDVDYTAADLGLPNIVPYLQLNESSPDYDGVIFSVSNSPVLDRGFFSQRGITFPSYIAPFSLQLDWFKQYVAQVCPNRTDCDRVSSSLLLFGDIEANDIGFPLVQGKSIEEVRTYVPPIIEAQINAGRELIRMGAKRIAFTASAPLGCFPYILTNLSSTNPLAYDALGCLRTVNDLITWKNIQLQLAVSRLILEYPNVTIIYADYYSIARLVISQTSITGGRNATLTACCGIGGGYNFDSTRFCGSAGVLVCSNPEKFISWDGLHFTQETYRRIERLLVPPALPLVGCTIQI